MKTAICLLLLLVVVWPEALGQEVQRPNIVVILCDDLGYGDVGLFNPERGKIATPHIDRLAAEGMHFTDAHSSSSVCTPTRYSLLTGRYNWRTRLQKGVLEGMSPPLIAKQRMTVASLLQAHGYTTACVGKWHLGLEFGPQPLASPIEDGPLQHGFDEFFGTSASTDMPPFAWIAGDRFLQAPTVTKKFLREGPASPDFEVVDVLPTLARKGVEYIHARAKEGERPFFLYLPLTSPHTPIAPSSQWQGKSGLGAYADFVMQTDAVVGEIIEAIDQAGLRDNTLIYLTSDNGCSPQANFKALATHGHYPSGHLRGYKADLWEGGHRVPLVVRWPDVVAPGGRSDQMVGLIDLLATVAEIVGATLPPEAGEDSLSMLPLLEGEDEPTRDFDIYHSFDGRFAIRQGEWKLLMCAGSGGWSQPTERRAAQQGLPEVQLYNLSEDLGERQNLAADRPEIVDRLSALLEKSITDGRTTPGPRQPNDVEVER